LFLRWEDLYRVKVLRGGGFIITKVSGRRHFHGKMSPWGDFSGEGAILSQDTGAKPTATRTETAAPTAVIRLPGSRRDIADAVIRSENTHTPTDTNETTVKSTHAPPTHTPVVSSLFTIPTIMESVNIPKVLCRISGYTFPIMLDTGAQVSVLPLKMVKRFQPPVTVPTKTSECGTFGTAKVTLRGPVLLPIHIAGIKLSHYFYFIDTDAPPLVGYEIMRAARLVIDVTNILVFSCRDDWSGGDKTINPQGPNPPVSLKNSSIHACVHFFQGSFLPIIEEEDKDVDALLPDDSQPSPVDEISTANSEVDGPSLIVDNSVPAFVRPCGNSELTSEFTSEVEPPSTQSTNTAAVASVASEVSSYDGSSFVQSSSVVSRQLSVVRSPLGCRAFPLNPRAATFRPRVEPSRDAPLLFASTPSHQPLYLPVHPLVDPNETVTSLSVPSGSVFAVTPPTGDLSVPPHLQELFDQTVEQANLSTSLQQNLAAVLRHNSVTFATGPEDLGFCGMLPHHMDTGDAHCTANQTAST